MAVAPRLQAHSYVVTGPYSLQNTYTSTPLFPGDFNGDGRTDLAFCYYGNGIWIYSQQADGHLAFASRQSNQCSNMFVLDLNGDGLDDIFDVAPGGGDVVQEALLAMPDGGFVKKTLPWSALMFDAIKLSFIDVNRDGKPDQLVLGRDFTFRYLLGDGTGHFGAEHPMMTVDVPCACDITVGDLNADGLVDFALTGLSYVPAVSTLQVFLNQGNGSFNALPRRDFSGYVFTHAAIGDVNGDGRNDLVVTGGSNSTGANVLVFEQNASGTLANPVWYPTYYNPSSVLASDIDGDGFNDVVVNHPGWSTVTTYLQASSILSPETPIYSLNNNGDDPHGIAAGDFDSDGCKDVAASSGGGYYMLRSTGCVMPPSVDTAVQLQSNNASTTVTVQNKNTSVMAADSVVRVYFYDMREFVGGLVNAPANCTRFTEESFIGFECKLGQMAPGNSVNLYFTYLVKARQFVARLTAQVSSNGFDPVKSDNRATSVFSSKDRRYGLPGHPPVPPRQSVKPLPERTGRGRANPIHLESGKFRSSARRS
jgi:hypothetical protein